MHGWFLAAGKVDQLFDFEVVRLRDGGNYSQRQVFVRQGDDEICFTCLCGFVRIASIKTEINFQHQLPFPKWAHGVDITQLPYVPDVDIPWWVAM